MERKKLFPIAVVIMLAVASTLWHDTTGSVLIHVKMLILAFAQNISFSIISRARNRNSDNYHLLAAICSNGVWFLTFQHLVVHDMTPSMILPFITGTTLGSLFGAYVSRGVETILGLTADATKQLNQNDTVKTSYFKKYILFVVLGCVGVSSVVFSQNPEIIGVILPLAYINHVMMGLSSRAKNRGSHNYLIITTVLSGTVWFLTFGYLVKNNMNISLFIPYTVATVFGSITSARVSMKIERFFGFKPDEKQEVSTEYQGFSSFIRSWKLLFAIVFLGSFYVVCQKSGFFNLSWMPLTDKPLLILLAGALLFGSQSMTYVISSRASNRDNMIYHLYGRLINGAVTFLTYKYFVMFNASPDIFAPIVTGSTLGNVFGQKIGMKIESKIGAKMDSEPNTKSKMTKKI